VFVDSWLSLEFGVCRKSSLSLVHTTHRNNRGFERCSNGVDNIEQYLEMRST
jgi:hypothetical protein